MSRFTEVLEEPKKVPLSQRLQEELDEESYKDFLSALENPKISAPAIQRALAAMGIHTSTMTILRLRGDK